MPCLTRAARSNRRSLWRLSSVGLAAAAASLLLAPVVVQAQSSPPGVHVVQAGDTLSQIALDASTDADSIAALNGLTDGDTLSIGQSLKLPAGASTSTSTSTAASTPAAAAASTTAPTTASSGGTYTVADGDTLWDIAQRLATTSDALVQLNHLDDPDHLSLGSVLSVPAGSTTRAASAAPAAATAPATPASAATPRRSVFVSYTVQPGETLSQIARQFDVRGDTIVQASNLDDPNKIAVGSVLKVPVPAREHVVNPGETLRDIAASEKVDLGSLIDFNQLDDPKLIRVGQVVLLPVAANQQVAASTSAPSAVPSAGDAQAPSTSAAAAAAAPAPAPPGPSGPSASAPSASAAPAPAAPASASPPTSTPTPTSTPAPTPTATVTTAAAATPATPASPLAAAKPSPAPKPAAPVAVVAPPPGAPSDGLAGAGLKLLGSPYAWGGANPSGFDCSGFVWYIARQIGRPLSRSMFGQYNSGSHPARDQLQVGDLVFFQNTFSPGLSHNGVYIGNNQFVNAADEASGVTISNLNTAYWSSHWFGATRLP
jgi:peptidoglycan endopeptidase LytE